MPVYISQVDFARANDSVRHPAIRRAMLRRGVPPPVVAPYIKYMSRSDLIFVHAGWQTRPVAPTVGLRQGCSLGGCWRAWRAKPGSVGVPGEMGWT